MRVQFLWSTRTYRGPFAEWELARGFRVTTVAPGWFAFFLGGRSLDADSDALRLVPCAGEEAFLLGILPPSPSREWLEAGRSVLKALGWREGVVAILADFRRRSLLGRFYKQSRAVFQGGMDKGAAFWVWQTMPLPARGDLAFFSVEQQLFQWGRVGRHVRRRCRWRRFFP